MSALPSEVDDKCYLIRMTLAQTVDIIEEDGEYHEDGKLMDEIKEEYEEKY